MDPEEQLMERAVLAGRVTRVDARHLVGTAADDVLLALVEAGRLLHVPGSGGSRAARSGHYLPVQHGPDPSEVVLEEAARRFAGQRGTLALFVGLWNGPRPEVLSVLLGLQRQGRARGGSVGATYVFHVDALPVALPSVPETSPVACAVVSS